MADNNRGRDDRYQQSNNNWQEDRNRFEDENRNRSNSDYGNNIYGSEHQNQSVRGGWNNIQGDNRWRQQTGNQSSGGAYSSDYGYQGGGYDQNNRGSGSSNQNWQNSGNQSQQWRDEDWNSRNEAGDYGGEERRRINASDNSQNGNRRNTGSDYNQGWNQENYGTGYRNGEDYDDRYRNTGYGESSGMTSGYSNRDDRRRNDNWNQGNNNRNNDRGWWDRTSDEVSSWFGDDDAEHRRQMDKMSGPHRGKGPKDYQRSEERIREDVCHRLYEDDRVDASDIQVDIQKDEVILSGTVNSRDEKRRAEDVVESIYGVRNVENRIRVARNDSDRFDRYTGTTSDSGGVGRESGTTNEIIRNTNNEKRRNNK
jgi:osmotically-inducible protein OsmY